jgi:hypothetical protein
MQQLNAALRAELSAWLMPIENSIMDNILCGEKWFLTDFKGLFTK